MYIIYIYIYIHRSISLSISLSLYIYIYICIYRPIDADATMHPCLRDPWHLGRRRRQVWATCSDGEARISSIPRLTKSAARLFVYGILKSTE